MQLVSVIVPVYNVNQYLVKCLESIINQIYENLEIILVDDGSTDNSGIICDEYSKKDKRIKVIHKENGGLSDARNAGIEIAKGEYLTFIDSDDFIAEDYIEYLYNLLKKYNAEVSVCCKINFYENEEIDKVLNTERIMMFTGQEAMENLFYQKEITPSAWAKLYSREIFKEIRYPKGKIYEDLGTTYKVFFEAKKVVWSSAQKYFYLQRQNSIMRKKFSASNFDRIEMSQNILEFVDMQCRNLHQAASVRFFISNIQVLRELPLKNIEYRDMIKQIKYNIKRYRKIVLFDGQAKKITRVIAFFTFLPIGFLKTLGYIYKLIYRD